MDNEEKENALDVASDRGGLHTDEESDYDGPGPEPFEDEKPTFPPDLEWLEELYEEENAADDDDLPVVADRSGKMIHAKTARMFKLRRNLDQLDTLHQQKEQNVINAREELKLCRQNIQSLMEQRDCLEREIEQQKGDNSVAVFRLRAQHKHLCQTLQSEEELEGNIDRVLKQQELELTEIEVELGRVSPLREELKEEEQVFQVLKGQKAATRLQHEKQARKNLQLKSQLLRDKQAERGEGTECQKKIEEVQASHKVASKHLKKTIERMQQQKAEKDQQMKEIQEKRTQAVNSLKLNIAAAQESLQVQQSGARANAPRKEYQHRQLTKSLQTQGTNSSKHMYQQKQLEERKRKQEEVEERQKSKRVEIVAKILQEEQLVKSRKRHQALVPKPSTTDKRSSQGGATEELLLYLDDRSSSAREEGATVQSRDFSDISSSSSASSDIEDLEDTMHQEEDLQSHVDSLIKPEFSGLWDQNYKKFLNEKPTSVQTEVKQEEPAMASPKLNMPKSATKVHGKQFKGTSFSSKPDIIFFKDFEVGKKYKKKIVLTNVSYMNSHCRLLGVSANLKNCITINLDSPDLLPTGMSCDVHAVFQPMINEDLEGEVQFSSAVGPFSVSVRCTTKRCDMEVDERFIDFGMHVVGQAISRTIILTNKGALATLFSLEASPCVIQESQPVRMLSQVSANTCQETTSKNPTSDNQTSSASIETGEPQLEQECHRLSDKLLQGHTVSEASAADPQAVPEACESIDAVSQMDQSDSDFGDISLGNVRGGEVGPFESIKLEFLFTPTIPGEAKLDFRIKFSDLNSKPIPIQVRGVAASIPVWVERSTIDLKICTFDRFYQDIITIQSRSSIALKLTFEVCSEMKKHMEVLPKTCFIQAQSSFNALLKFQPRCSLAENAKKCYDRDTGVLEVPMTVQVAGQMKPVHFTVQAIVTSSDLQFDRTEVDFGYSSIYQSVKSSVHLTNLSLLPQDFGFLDVPEFIEVQPNDGFGTLLPRETMEIFLIFNAKKAKAYSFKLSCKSGINRDFLLSCRAVGFCPPLKLSHSLVKFGATAVGSHSTAVLHLINHKTKNNQPQQPISPGMAPIAAKMFSFALPEDSDISITPSAGSLPLGKKQQIQVTFRPRLREQEIKEEALRLFHRLGPLPEKEFEKNSHTEQQQDPVEIGKEKKTSVILNNNMASDGKMTDQPTESTDTAEIQQGSQLYEKARLSLLCSFTQRFREYSIPCYVLDGEPSENDIETQQPWSTLNTLYLKLQCPAIQPPLVVISNNGHNIINFHQVAVEKIKKIMVQNISHESLDLKSFVLDLKGPFSLLNALRCLRPGEIHTPVVAFTPFLEERYFETLEVHSHRMTLEMTLSGDGCVVPVVTCIQSGDLLDFWLCLQNSSVCGSKVQGADWPASLPPGLRVKLMMWPTSLGSYKNIKVQPRVGTQNYSGLSVFSVVPVEGSIAPGQSKDITVTFQPDHPSVNYSDRLTVELMNKNKVCVMDLKGAASSHNMYLYGEELLTVPTEALLPPLGLQFIDSEVMEKPTVSVLVTLQAGCCTGAITPAVRELQVGCIRSAQPSKKSGEFHWDNLALLQQQGFNVEPSKGTVEAGQTRTIVVTWTPHSGYKPYEMVQTCALLTLKGDERHVYKVTLMASVSTTAD
ncbi:LOW QUALITY PROTEIN: cilia- and flagella-associated protein 74 [Labrus bergylta]|uniref:LOW QUALITY PROTEIN: cilia- and flagella-associated protein 74 n=1 Tax=Labrus bergylta TaxID=56723 RepID=UPI0033143CD9